MAVIVDNLARARNALDSLSTKKDELDIVSIYLVI